MEPARPKTFAEFWPYYVGEHSHPKNRRLHFFGTSFTLLFVVLAIALRNPWYLLGMPLAGYGAAWFGHFVVERNRPATFKYPLMSLMGDYKMFALMCTGKMDAEVERCKQITAGRKI